MSFTKLKSVHFKRLGRSFEDSEFTSWGIIDTQGKLTNAGALIADDSQSVNQEYSVQDGMGLI